MSTGNDVNKQATTANISSLKQVASSASKRKPRHIPNKTESIKLDYKERRLVVNAATQYYNDRDRNTIDGMDRLNRIKKFMDLYEIMDFEDALAHQMNAEKAVYLQALNSGNASVKMPRITPQIIRGSECEIVMPKALFGLIQEILKKAKHNPDDSEYVATLNDKFLLEIKDPSFELPDECFE